MSEEKNKLIVGIARPKFDNDSQKYLIEVDLNGKKLCLGEYVNEGSLLFRYSQFDDIKQAIAYIKKDDRLKLDEEFDKIGGEENENRGK